MKDILRGNLGLNVNWRNEGENGTTALLRACRHGRDAIVSILLAHPDIDVNQKDDDGYTAFMWACTNGKSVCVRLLLGDSRVEVNEPRNDGSTPLWWAASRGHLDPVRWWIASGRALDLGQPGGKKTDAIGRAREKGNDEVRALLERFKNDAAKTRDGVKKELGING